VELPHEEKPTDKAERPDCKSVLVLCGKVGFIILCVLGGSLIGTASNLI
jgi:drug/metabolite transporter (DMT)-like permease